MAGITQTVTHTRPHPLGTNMSTYETDFANAKAALLAAQESGGRSRVALTEEAMKEITLFFQAHYRDIEAMWILASHDTA